MRLIAGGDTTAFEQLIERHQTLVAGTVARMLGSNSDVEDIAQQVFIRVWKSAGRYVPRAKFTTWLLKITRNLVFNELRRTKRRAHIPIQTEPSAEEIPLKDRSGANAGRVASGKRASGGDREAPFTSFPRPSAWPWSCAATRN